MAWAREHWYIGAFFGVEIVWFLLLKLLLRSRKDQPDPVPGVKEPIRGWRLVEVVLVFYHFPMILLCSFIGRKNSAPPWAVYGLTPVLYSGIVVLFSVWG